jgi:hypothetical protein
MAPFFANSFSIYVFFTNESQTWKWKFPYESKELKMKSGLSALGYFALNVFQLWIMSFDV